jgi:crotonobetainyl-CoA:carnitine CoA-transferase CaiB-like acyl-CoA transferase
MILGDLGADVIKIEEVGPLGSSRGGQSKESPPVPHPPEYASTNSVFNPLNRNKRSICLNLKSPEAKKIFHRLAEKADVVIDGFRPGVTTRLGIDYETLKEINPGIIYCAITSYGQDGPYEKLPGHDINYVASAGIAGVLRKPGETPPVPGNFIGDMAGGGMQAAIGILAALAAREKTGQGQMVDISMTDGAVSMLSLYLGGYYERNALPAPEERTSTGVSPSYTYYLTADGKYIAIAASEPWFFTNLCKALDCEDLITHQMKTEKTDEIFTRFRDIFLTRTSQEWFEILSRADVPVSRVNTLDELADDPQVKHRRMVLELDGPGGEKVRQTGISIKLSETPGSIRNLGSIPGADTRDILAGLGYSGSEIEKLLDEGAIGTGQ